MTGPPTKNQPVRAGCLGPPVPRSPLSQHASLGDNPSSVGVNNDRRTDGWHPNRRREERLLYPGDRSTPLSRARYMVTSSTAGDNNNCCRADLQYMFVSRAQCTHLSLLFHWTLLATSRSLSFCRKAHGSIAKHFGICSAYYYKYSTFKIWSVLIRWCWRDKICGIREFLRCSCDVFLWFYVCFFMRVCMWATFCMFYVLCCPCNAINDNKNK